METLVVHELNLETSLHGVVLVGTVKYAGVGSGRELVGQGQFEIGEFPLGPQVAHAPDAGFSLGVLLLLHATDDGAVLLDFPRTFGELEAIQVLAVEEDFGKNMLNGSENKESREYEESFHLEYYWGNGDAGQWLRWGSIVVSGRASATLDHANANHRMDGTMKGLLTILCLSWALTGCQKPDLEDPDVFEEIASQAIDRGTLEAKRVKGLLVLCIPDTEKPFSGWVKENYDNGQLKRLGYLNDGAKDGLWTSWHENGRKQMEIRYKKDVMHGTMSTWYANGQKKGVGQIKDGEMDGRWEEWYENGWKSKVQNCDFGKLISATVWKPDGEKCPVTNVVNGNGELIDYNDDGTIEIRYTFKDGVGIEDSNRTNDTSP